MNFQEILKPTARNIKKEWRTLGIDKIGASKHEYGIALKSHLQTINNQTVILSALLTPSINRQKNVNMIVDITLPKSGDLESCLGALSAFMQQTTALLNPITLLVDMRTSQIILRQCQIMPIAHPPATTAFINAIQLLVPLLQPIINTLCQTNPSQDDARELANQFVNSFQGALKNESTL